MTIYLDNNATTRPVEAVAEGVRAALGEWWHNPSSIHRPGQVARQQIELARKHLAALIGAKPRNITLCGSGTEAIDLAIRGALLAQSRVGGSRKQKPGAIATSKVEHSAVRELAEALEREEGMRTHWLGLDTDGVVRAETVREALERDPEITLVSVQWANNETGAVHPVHEIGRVCREKGVLFHTDATQWVGKMPTVVEGGSGRVEPLTCDLLTYSPHKFHGVKGVGVLWARAGIRTAPLIHGEQELGRRGGTENVPGIVGGGIAAQLAMAWTSDAENMRRGARLRDRFERLVLERVRDAVVNGPREAEGEEPGTRRLWNTTNIGFPRLEAEALLLLLSERGVCASAGAACSSGSLDPSPVLRAIGIPAEVAHGSLRFSISRETSKREVEEGAKVVAECAERLRASMASL